MNKAKFMLAIFIFFLLSCANTPTNNTSEDNQYLKEQRQLGNTIIGKVIGISDGDTFRLLADGNRTVRIRLYGIDAPEKAQDYGTQSRQALSNLIFSKEVEVVQKSKDRYGRVIGISFVDGLNVNEEMLRIGLVWHYTDYDKSERWANLQKEARQGRRGLWNQPNPTPPWQWRKEKRQERAESE
jgi:endonuclease YncB( thermonuclease family)